MRLDQRLVEVVGRSRFGSRFSTRRSPWRGRARPGRAPGLRRASGRRHADRAAADRSSPAAHRTAPTPARPPRRRAPRREPAYLRTAAPAPRASQSTPARAPASSSALSPKWSNVNAPPNRRSSQSACPAAAYRRIRAGRPRDHRALERVVVRRVQRRRGQGRGRRQPAAVDQAPRERVVAREPQRGVAERAARRALRRDEVGAAGGVTDVLVGGELALARIAVEQRVGRAALEHQAQLPGEVVGVLHAGVGAARPERRHAMRAVAGEQHAAMPERSIRRQAKV